MTIPLYPMFLDLAGRRCLVVGAGPVGQRKAAGLVAAGAAVRIVAPESPGLAGVEWVRGEYDPAHLDGTALVFAAGPPDVNARVVADARAQGIWVNSASDPEAGDFVVPAVRRAGGIELAVGTGGASPALASKLAAALIAAVGPAWPVWVELLAGLRAEVRRRVPDGARPALWQRLSDPVWLDRIRTADRAVALAEMRALVDAAAGP